MNIWLLAGGALAAWLVAKKPTAAANAQTIETSPASGVQPILQPQNLPMPCNPPPTGSKPGPMLVFYGMRIKTMISPDGNYWLGPEEVGVPATLGIKPPSCLMQYEGPLNVNQIVQRGYKFLT